MQCSFIFWAFLTRFEAVLDGGDGGVCFIILNLELCIAVRYTFKTFR